MQFGTEETVVFQQKKQTGCQSSRSAAEQIVKLRCSHLCSDPREHLEVDAEGKS